MPSAPVKIGLIGGTGLGDAIAAAGGKPHYPNTPFGSPSDAIHEIEWSGIPVFALARHGPGHRLSPADVPYQANLFAMKMLGVTHVLASGAVGSLREEYRPRDLVVIEQAIDKTFRRPGSFFEKSAVHVELSEPFCPVLRQILKDAGEEMIRKRGEQSPVRIHHGGCYVAMEGPSFSTRAESLMHRLWGGDLVGMTLMPEAKLAREAELPYAMLALVTDYDSWRPPLVANAKPAAGVGASAEPTTPRAKHELLAEIIGNVRAASENALELLRMAVAHIAADPSKLADCPARDALELAIWSDKSKLETDEIERLRPIWGRYFPGR
jgi:5'-methylthioadenosine phosphorylase